MYIAHRGAGSKFAIVVHLVSWKHGQACSERVAAQAWLFKWKLKVLVCSLADPWIRKNIGSSFRRRSGQQVRQHLEEDRSDESSDEQLR